MPNETTIRDPQDNMTPEERADQMWRAHPRDLERLGFATRVAFYEAHIRAAIAKENENEHDQ